MCLHNARNVSLNNFFQLNHIILIFENYTYRGGKTAKSVGRQFRMAVVVSGKCLLLAPWTHSGTQSDSSSAIFKRQPLRQR